MEDKKTPIWASGIFFSKPQPTAPEWVKGKLSFKVKEAIEFLKAYEDKKGWVNVDMMKSKEKGTIYLQLNQWVKPEGLEEKEIPF